MGYRRCSRCNLGVFNYRMMTKMSPKVAFVLAPLWACIGIWGLNLSNAGFAIGGFTLATAFLIWGLARLRSHSKP